MKIAYPSVSPISYSLVRAADGGRYNFASGAWDAGSDDPPTPDQLRALASLAGGPLADARAADLPGLADPSLAARAGSYGSFRFTGASAHVIQGAAACLSPTRAFTWSAWARRRGDVPANATLLGEGNSRTDRPVFRVFVDSATGQHMALAWRDDAGHVVTILGAVAVADPAWHHVAVTCDGSTLALYVDGRPDGTADVTGLGAMTVDRLCFGGLFRAALAFPFPGDMEDIRGYGRALSAAEVAAVAREWLTGPAGDGDVQVIVWSMAADGKAPTVRDVIPLAWLVPGGPMPGGAMT